MGNLKIFGISWVTVLIAAVVAWFVYSRFIATRR